MDIQKLADSSLHEVAGILASQDLDRDGECFDYDGSKPLFQQWSKDLYEATKKTALPGEESYGNVRLMHGHTTVGKLIKIVYDDVKKTIWGIAKITDDKVWDDIQKGVYSAFSIAGKLVRSIVKAGKSWITVQPLEVSVVDYPSNPTTTFDWARGACFAKFASTDPTLAPDAVPDQDNPSPGKVPNSDPTVAHPDLPAVRAMGKPDTQDGLHDSEPAASENKIPNPTLGVDKMTDTEKLAAEKAAEVAKAARKSLHDHFSAMKSACTSHAGEMNHTKCAKHAAAMHDLIDKCAKLAGEPDFDADTEHEGGQPHDGDSDAATDTTVKAALAEIAKLAASVKELTGKLEAKEVAEKAAVAEKEKAAKAAESIVGDRKDAVPTGTDAVSKAAEEKKKADATLELAKAAMGATRNEKGEKLPADPKAMDALYNQVTNAKAYRAARQ